HFAKCPVVIVVKQRIRHVVIRDKDVLPTVVVIVERHNAKSVAGVLGQSRRFAQVCECAIAVIVIKAWRLGMEIVWMTVATHSAPTPARCVTSLNVPSTLLW